MKQSGKIRKTRVEVIPLGPKDNQPIVEEKENSNDGMKGDSATTGNSPPAIKPETRIIADPHTIQSKTRTHTDQPQLACRTNKRNAADILEEDETHPMKSVKIKHVTLSDDVIIHSAPDEDSVDGTEDDVFNGQRAKVTGRPRSRRQNTETVAVTGSETENCKVQ